MVHTIRTNYILVDENFVCSEAYSGPDNFCGWWVGSDHNNFHVCSITTMFVHSKGCLDHNISSSYPTSKLTAIYPIHLHIFLNPGISLFLWSLACVLLLSCSVCRSSSTYSVASAFLCLPIHPLCCFCLFLPGDLLFHPPLLFLVSILDLSHPQSTFCSRWHLPLI